MYRLPQTTHPLDFPDDIITTPEGLLAVGGNLHPLTLINAYAKGIFPWFSQDDPTLWWHPDPRLVIFPESVHLSRRMSQILNKISLPSKKATLRKGQKPPYFVTLNKSFHKVIEECASKRGKGRESTWITQGMITSYIKLHEMKFAHSVEVWNEKQELVGGMYGISLGKVFFGESMFSHESNTSKIALYWLCDLLKMNDFVLLDCQIVSDHLKKLGATEISGQKFMEYLVKGKTYLKRASVLASSV
jgi:leucyl/phenylalanyl-tRNA---protein transferase